MNDEIKEILECMKNYGSSTELALLDYITNLQQENEKLREENNILKELNVCVGCETDYKSRIEKAIKHLETDLEINGKYDNEEIEPLYSKKVFGEICNELFVILRGKDNV